MGCAQSRLDNEESVSRCKDRRNLMKQAVMVRNAFASAHSAYAMALKNTGAALNDYAQGEAPPPPQSPVVVSEPASEPPPPPPPHMMERTPLPPPPPPLPSFSPLPPPLPSFSPLPPLQRAMTMPEFSKSRGKMKSIAIDEEEEDEEEEGGLKLRNKRNGVEKSGPVDNETPIKTPEPPPPPPAGVAWDYFFTVDNMPGTTLGDVEEEDEEEDEYVEENDEGHDSPRTPKFENVGGDHDGVEEFKTPEKGGIDSQMEETPTPVKEKHFVHSNTAPPGIRGFMNGGKVGTANSADFYKVLGEIDDHFLKLSQCAQEVSKMLEATRMHYHSNFADKENINHAERVMQIITWNKSLKGISNGNGANDNFDGDESETHATVLDKLLAWEKKLYEELKAGEIIKHEYQRKIAILNKLKKRNASSESLEKVKAAVSHLHTRYIVEMQSLDSTVAEVNEIRDKQLYPKLAALVHGMAKMWQSMCRHHEDQMRIVMELSSIDISATPMETSKHHQSDTIQLADVIKEWHDQFENLVNNQKMYIQALNSWLKLNLIPVESSLREKPSSPLRVQNPPIQPLLHAWNEVLEKLPDEHSRSAINSFEAVIRTIIIHQEEEVKLKEKCEETRKEYMRKRQSFEDWYHKYMQRRTPPDEMDPDRRTDANGKDPISERQFVVDSLQKRLDEETEAYQKHCIQVREKSLGTLKIQLPELFRAMRDYSHMSFNAYESLRMLVASQNPNQAS